MIIPISLPYINPVLLLSFLTGIPAFCQTLSFSVASQTCCLKWKELGWLSLPHGSFICVWLGMGLVPVLCHCRCQWLNYLQRDFFSLLVHWIPLKLLLQRNWFSQLFVAIIPFILRALMMG